MIKLSLRSTLIPFLSLVLCGTVAIALAGSPSAEPSQAKPKINHYIGVAKCKNCHNVADNGNQYECWTKSKHSQAFKTLASEDAKKVATAKGIADAQKDDKCVKCHVTAFGVADDQLQKGFDRTLGVQCEACHGPGETHMKARLAAAAAEENADPKVRKTVPEGEIIVKVEPKACQGCHNEESPSFKPFCYHKRVEEIAHYDPRSNRKPTGKLTSCPCDDKCECKKGDCKDLPKK